MKKTFVYTHLLRLSGNHELILKSISNCCFYFHILLFLGLASLPSFMWCLFVGLVIVLVLNYLTLLIHALIVQVQVSNELWKDVLQLGQRQIRAFVEHIVCPNLEDLLVVHWMLNKGSFLVTIDFIGFFNFQLVHFFLSNFWSLFII